MAYIQDWGMRVQAQPQINTTRRAFLHLSQNENGRMLNIRITDVNIPAGSTAVLAGTKPDGTVYSQAGTLVNNTATFAEDVQMTAVAGTWDAKITVTNGGNCICTARITITIDPDTVAGGAVPSDSQLDGIIAECRAIADSVRKEAYGSPLVADAVEDMTDQSRVYVYTGSESGMTAGHWYYYNGTAWADGGVYNAVAVDTDTTLSIAGKAADAKEVGDQLTSVKENLIYRIKAITDGFSVTSTGVTSLYLNAGETVLIDVKSYSGNVDVFIQGYTSTNVVRLNNVKVFEYTAVNSGYLNFYFQTGATLNAYVTFKTILGEDVKSLINDTKALTQIDSLSLELGSINTNNGKNSANSSYLRTVGYINESTKKITFQNARVRVFAYTKNGTFVGGYGGVNGYTKDWSKYVYLNSPVYISDLNGDNYLFRLVFDNISGTVAPETVNGKEYIDVIDQLKKGQPEEYTVGTNGDFSTFTEMLVALKDNTNEKTVYISGGTYDIFEEIGGADYMATVNTSSNWRDVCNVVPPNTTIIGVGNVLLAWNPTDAEIIDSSHAFLFSPLNLSGNCKIKNIKVQCSNCRYGIHDETSGNSAYDGTVHEFENVSVVYTASTYGVKYAYGAGHNKNSKYKFKNCLFSSANGDVWSTHDWSAGASENSVFEFDNCVFWDSLHNKAGNIRLSSSDTVGRLDDVKINACVFNRVSFSTEGSVDVKQGYKVTTMLCKPYTPTWSSHILEADRIAPTDYLVLG